MTTLRALQTSAAVRRLPIMLAVALAIFLAAGSCHAQQLAAASEDHLHVGQRGLLAANDDDITIVPRKNVTKAELIKLLDSGVAPGVIPTTATTSTVATAGGRKLSQRAGYCRSRYYNCGSGCTLRCSGSTGYCYKNLWRCAGTYNTWYCNCGWYLACYYSYSGVYATCMR